MSTLKRLLRPLLARTTPTSPTLTEEQQTAFWKAVNEGGVKFAQEIVDLCLENGATDVSVADAAGWGFDG